MSLLSYEFTGVIICCQINLLVQFNMFSFWQTRLQTNPLNVSVLHKVVVSHQSCAIYLLHHLKELAEQSGKMVDIVYQMWWMVWVGVLDCVYTDGLSRLISMCMIEPSLAASNQCILDMFFLNDNSLWIGKWHFTLVFPKIAHFLFTRKSLFYPWPCIGIRWKQPNMWICMNTSMRMELPLHCIILSPTGSSVLHHDCECYQVIESNMLNEILKYFLGLRRGDL